MGSLEPCTPCVGTTRECRAGELAERGPAGAASARRWGHALPRRCDGPDQLDVDPDPARTVLDGHDLGHLPPIAPEFGRELVVGAAVHVVAGQALPHRRRVLGPRREVPYPWPLVIPIHKCSPDPASAARGLA